MLLYLKNSIQHKTEIRTPAHLIENECGIRSPATLQDFNGTQNQYKIQNAPFPSFKENQEIAKRRSSHVIQINPFNC